VRARPGLAKPRADTRLIAGPPTITWQRLEWSAVTVLASRCGSGGWSQRIPDCRPEGAWRKPGRAAVRLGVLQSLTAVAIVDAIAFNTWLSAEQSENRLARRLEARFRSSTESRSTPG
jgi:hypothetical protein